ncbi:Transcriptional regulator, IclR family [Marinobacterium lacunae]|uniref:Transcriptional regulator, IclR family n=1 Tax=Marinobacterium lacunae TaxID=1232683 RepID=A0A081G013_9GAMM|nr:IclR family transcriptional regulator [Marinobacterium lacunae]KEA64118.1 Transcriptional regulator, IclR family [Marinobacterium lacunae]
MAKEEEDRLLVKSVVKAFRLLEVFDETAPALSIKELSLRCDMDRSATQRFVHTLTELGYLQRNPDTKLIEPSLRSLDLASHYLHAHPLVDKARPYLLNLSKETEGSVSLSVLDRGEVVFLSRLLSRNMLETDITIGSRLPAYCTSPGLAMLSHLGEEQAREMIEAYPRKAYTPHTIYELDKILARLPVFRQQGYALTEEEYYLSDLSISAPILDAAGQPRAAVSISISRLRGPVNMEADFSALLIATARQLSKL